MSETKGVGLRVYETKVLGFFGGPPARGSSQCRSWAPPGIGNLKYIVYTLGDRITGTLENISTL